MLGAPVGETDVGALLRGLKSISRSPFFFGALAEAKRDALRTLANHVGEKVFHLILASLEGD
jgi:hypothetical protein